MKNYFNFYLILLTSIFIFSSCSDEVNFTEEQNSAQQDVKLITNGNKSSNGNSMLHFSDIEAYKKTILKLEAQYEEYDDAFLEHWAQLNDEELDKKEDELGYTPQQPFIDFEKQFNGFKSLREVIDEKEKKWLNNETLDEANDPYDHFVFDEEERTVLNKNAQVKIGKELYQMTMFGYIKITDGDFATLDLVLNNDIRNLHLSNVVIVGSYDGTVDNSNTQSTTTTDGTSGSTTTTGTTSTDTSCRTDFDATQYYYPSSNRKIKGYQKLDKYTWAYGTAIRAKTRHFKKKHGRWKCRRGHIGVRIMGDATASRTDYNDPCYEDRPENENKYKNRRKVKVRVSVSSASNIYFGTYQHKLHTKHRRYSTEYTKYFWN